MARTIKEDHKLMDLLKVSEVTRIICETNMGALKLRLRKNETEYRFVLDSVELDKDTNKELFELLYPVNTGLIGYIDRNTEPVLVKNSNLNKATVDSFFSDTAKAIKPKGRPKGTKSK